MKLRLTVKKKPNIEMCYYPWDIKVNIIKEKTREISLLGEGKIKLNGVSTNAKCTYCVSNKGVRAIHLQVGDGTFLFTNL